MNSEYGEFIAPWIVIQEDELVEELTATQVQRAEITKGRFITDKEKALIEMRIATRKALRGE